MKHPLKATERHPPAATPDRDALAIAGPPAARHRRPPNPGATIPFELLAEYAFLCERHIDAATLERAAELAIASATPVHETLIASGWLTEDDYVHALSVRFGLPIAAADDLLPPDEPPRTGRLPAELRMAGGVGASAVRATSLSPRQLHERARGARGGAVALTTSGAIEAAVLSRWSATLLDRAQSETAARAEFSARSGASLGQQAGLAVAAGLVIGGLAMAADVTLVAISIAMALPFFCVVLLRAIALTELFRRKREPAAAPRLADADLPGYSIMVPLFRETAVLPRLVASLTALDYPAAKLDIMLVLEASDEATVAAARKMELPGNVRVVVVPKGGPQTKPKAINYAVQLARGELVVVYDAEDRPDPGQLRMAAEEFARGDSSLACVQACLNLYNPHGALLTRQFALEYSVLFDALLPALERLRLPVPLGGTSNHFPLATLKAIGGWDPYNVTEDADLGIRLARLGLRTATIRSTTWEEAPTDFGNWWRQRTRWLKGWMQTWLVHNRRPRQLIGELGLLRWLGFQAFMGGVLLSVLAHPVFWLLVAIEAAGGSLLAMPDETWRLALWWVTGLNLVLGYLTSMLAGAIATIQRRRAWLAPWVLGMPVYWLLISGAGYRALWQLVRAPFLWEKTQHGGH